MCCWDLSKIHHDCILAVAVIMSWGCSCIWYPGLSNWWKSVRVVHGSALALCCSKALTGAYQRRAGGSGTFPQDIWPMLVLHTLQQVTVDKQQDVLPFHIPASARALRAVTRLQEADSCSKLDTITYPMTGEKDYCQTILNITQRYM